jgi:hypothetical protein
MTNSVGDENEGQDSVGLTGIAGMPPTIETKKSKKRITEKLQEGFTYIKGKTVKPIKAKLSEMAKERKQMKALEKKAYKEARLQTKKSELSERIEIAKQRGIKKAQWEAKPLGEKIGAITTKFKGVTSKFGDMPSRMDRAFGTMKPMQQGRQEPKKESVFGTIKPMDLGLGFKPIDVGTGFKPIDLGGFKTNKKNKKHKNKGIWI